jgi:60 kDa SS-A/Ro ribonucleoprotein
MNKNLFKTSSVPVATTVNEAGGKAYSFTDEHALAQYVVTGCFNGTFYASSEEQLDKIKTLATGCSSEFLAKCAVYGHEVASMKDTPAYLLAMLTARGENALVSSIFNRVITNSKMLCNYVQIIRSGVTGRKSFGTSIKNLIKGWLNAKTPDQLFNASIGRSAPSLADVIKMVHPTPKDSTYETMYGYLLGKKFDVNLLPDRIRSLELFKRYEGDNEVPNVDFRVLSNLKLSDENWKAIAKNMSWTTLRMNLNVLAKHNVFSDTEVTATLAEKLRDKDNVKRSGAFPYQLLTTFRNAHDVPSSISLALQDAMEIATNNIGKIGDGDISVCIDISGSMSSPVTGSGAAQTVSTCRDVASLIGCSVLRNNENAEIVPFHTRTVRTKLNPRDSVMTNSNIMARLPSGGTDCSAPIKSLNADKCMNKVVIMVSDNQSWCQYYGGGYSQATGMTVEWQKYKARVKNAKLVLIDLQPSGTTQVSDSNSVFNIGGFSDNIWPAIKKFVDGEKLTFTDVIQSVTI